MRGQAGEGSLGFPSQVSTARGIHTHPSSEHLGLFALCFLASASSAAAPSNKLAVRMEGIKGEVTVMSKAACFPLPSYVCIIHIHNYRMYIRILAPIFIHARAPHRGTGLESLRSCGHACSDGCEFAQLKRKIS